MIRFTGSAHQVIAASYPLSGLAVNVRWLLRGSLHCWSSCCWTHELQMTGILEGLIVLTLIPTVRTDLGGGTST